MISVYDSTEMFVDSPPEIAILPLAGFTLHDSNRLHGITELLINEICRRVADQLPVQSFLLPPWTYGTLPENAERVGDVVLHYETLSLVVHDIAMSLFDHGIKKLVVLNCLGSVNYSSALPDGNSIVKTAVRQLNYENHELTVLWVQPFRVSSEQLKRLFGNEITDDMVKNSILDYLFDHRSSNESEGERAVWKAYENNDGGQFSHEKADGLGEKVFAEITQAVVDYVTNTFSSIAKIKG